MCRPLFDSLRAFDSVRRVGLCCIVVRTEKYQQVDKNYRKSRTH